jgi:hypothetical protein
VNEKKKKEKKEKTVLANRKDNEDKDGENY